MTKEQLAETYAKEVCDFSEGIIHYDDSYYAFLAGYAAGEPKWISVKDASISLPVGWYYAYLYHPETRICKAITEFIEDGKSRYGFCTHVAALPSPPSSPPKTEAKMNQEYKTPEEILKTLHNHKEWDEKCYISQESAKKCMQAYAEQEAKAFAEWCYIEKWKFIPHLLCWSHLGSATKSTSELFILYKQQNK